MDPALAEMNALPNGKGHEGGAETAATPTSTKTQSDDTAQWVNAIVLDVCV